MERKIKKRVDEREVPDELGEDLSHSAIDP